MYNTDLPTRAELPSSRQLVRSTVLAAITALALLVAAVLPGEYGIDPTGIGRMLGLAQMGEIKVSLANEAAVETAKEAAATTAAASARAPVTARTATPSTVDPVKTDEVAVTLAPGQGAEVKLDMRKGARVSYDWSAMDGLVNFDSHGEPPNASRDFYHGYGKGRQVNGDRGMLEAAFDGKHGWFWRNRSSSPITVKLRTQGSYAAIKRVL